MQALEAIGALPIPNTSTGQSRSRVDQDSSALDRSQGPEAADKQINRPSDESETVTLSTSGVVQDAPAGTTASELSRLTPEGESLLAPPSAEEQLREAVQSIREQRPSLGAASFKISYNEDVSRYVVQIVDRETGDEIQQIPSEKLVELSKRLGEMRGLLFDEKS